MSIRDFKVEPTRSIKIQGTTYRSANHAADRYAWLLSHDLVEKYRFKNGFEYMDPYQRGEYLAQRSIILRNRVHKVFTKYFKGK